jgi:hypothetical protein
MAFQPMDIQVNVMQASNVAEMAAHEREEPKRAKSERARDWIQERQDEENTSDETAEEDEQNPVDEDGAAPGGQLTTLTTGPESPQEESEGEQNRPSEPDKGTHMDLTS